MVELQNWNTALVTQRDKILGCIPTGFEWMLRVSGVQGVDFVHFQEDFNLQAKGLGYNNFNSIADTVKNVYPNIEIKIKSFPKGDGVGKVNFIRTLIQNGSPCLMSLTLYQYGNWHIMPIIFIDNFFIRLVWEVSVDGNPKIVEFSLPEIINRHDYWPGGEDIAWLINKV